MKKSRKKQTMVKRIVGVKYPASDFYSGQVDKQRFFA